MSQKSDAEELGVVVVGLGIAGKVRVRDLQECGDIDILKNLKLKGFVSRREIEVENVPQISLEDALSRPDVHIIVVCTENSQHEATARQAILAKKHVLVEFPLATSAPPAQALLDSAKEHGVLCYEEDIALLSDGHKALTEQIKQKLQDSSLVTGNYEFIGKFNGWVENLQESGSPFISNITMLHVLTDWFGELTAKEASFTRDEDGFTGKALLHTKDLKPLHVTIRRQKECKRGKTFSFAFEDGTVLDKMPVTGPAKIGLFMRDFVQFMEHLTGASDPAPGQERTVAALHLAGQLDALCQSK